MCAFRQYSEIVDWFSTSLSRIRIEKSTKKQEHEPSMIKRIRTRTFAWIISSVFMWLLGVAHRWLAATNKRTTVNTCSNWFSRRWRDARSCGMPGLETSHVHRAYAVGWRDGAFAFICFCRECSRRMNGETFHLLMLLLRGEYFVGQTNIPAVHIRQVEKYVFEKTTCLTAVPNKYKNVCVCQ